MRRRRTFLICAGLLLVATAVYSYPENLLSRKLGASVSTKSKIWGDNDINAILSDKPISRGGFSFADVQQHQAFTVDLGQEKAFDRIQFGSDNGGGFRSPRILRIMISNNGPEGTFQIVLEKTDLGWQQTLRLPLCKARWVRFDFGEGKNGVHVHTVRIYKGYEHPKLADVTKFLHERIKPGQSGLEKFYSAANAGKWEQACKALRAYYTAKFPMTDDKPDSKYDLTRAKDYASGKLEYGGIPRQEVVPIDWIYQKNTDWYEHKNFLNRGSILGVPIDAYYHTGDKQWLTQFRNVFYDWVDANPKPTVMSGANYPSWRTLDSAARLSWLASRFAKATALKGIFGYSTVIYLRSPIEDELWANLLFSIWEHTDYLKNDDFTGGNWLATNSSSVMDIALKFPEFVDGKVWLEFGKVSFETNVLRDVHPDGKEMEDAPGYVCMAYSGMLSTLQSLDRAGVEVNPEARERLAKTQYYLAAVTQPNGSCPRIGDWGGGEAWALPAALDYYKKEDIKYVLTRGKEGVPPAQASVNFPDGGWTIMRSSYEEKPYENARHLVFKSSFGAHGHADVLQVTAYGYGRELLTDPGIRSYEGEDLERYPVTSYHNTICVDGKTMGQAHGKTEKWQTTDKTDYVIGSHQNYKGLTHRRSVIFVKPEYWIVHDDIIGEGDHTYDQNWHFEEDAGIVEDPITKAVHTSYPTGGNLLMVPVEPESLKSEITDFFIAKARFEKSIDNVPSKGWKYSKTGATPQTFDVVLYPYSGSVAPKVSVKRYPVEGAAATEATALEIKIGDKTDIVMFSRVGPREMKAILPGNRVSSSSGSDLSVSRTEPAKP
ncbi:MAG: alginate lyase family protein [Armatimonadota bacterium]|nr:alginate lyase family protein [Armatimonadota bacterium]